VVKPTTKSITHENSTISWIEDDIIYVKWKEGIDIEIPDVDELSVSFQKLTEGRKVKVIQDFAHFTSITSEARAHAAKTAPASIAVAYVIKSLGQRMILRFYVRMKKRPTPTKVFMKLEDAIDWLKTRS